MGRYKDADQRAENSNTGNGKRFQGFAFTYEKFKVQQKAAKVGFDWSNAEDALAKLYEECDELKEAVSKGDTDNQYEELGDVLFSAVNVARLLKIDSEHALYDACDKFIGRFSKVEALAKERGIDMKSATLSELDSLWDEVKIKE